MTTESLAIVEPLLAQLDEADQRIRIVYRELADDPGQATNREDELRDLHAQCGALAQRVGLTMLAQYRANQAPAPVAVTTPASGTNGASREMPPSADALETWKRAARENGLGRVPYEDRFDVPWEMLLDKLMTTLGRPRDLDAEVDDEIDALDVVGREPVLSQWSALPKRAQAAWLGHLAARTRAVMGLAGLGKNQRERLRTIIKRYPPWASEHRPGHVHGLRVDHEPLDGTWSDDAQRLWGALRELVERAPVELPSTSARPPPKKPDHDAAANTTEKRIDPSWPLWPLVRGRRALVLGGDPREPNRERLERFFEFASLEWPAIDGPRRTDAVVARINNRTVDIVVVLAGFVDHKQSEPIIAAARAHDVMWALADGYGATSIMSALERFHSKPNA